ncbi:MAG: hypothetical protein H6718_00175, partial [Polyangiaceae bacterium]|nr:hypothetical protein [Polyangiaceae bacterium]
MTYLIRVAFAADLQIGLPATFPCHLASTQVSLTFDLDAAYGPILTEIAAIAPDTATTTPRPFRLLRPADAPSATRNLGLWE